MEPQNTQTISPEQPAISSQVNLNSISQSNKASKVGFYSFGSGIFSTLALAGALITTNYFLLRPVIHSNGPPEINRIPEFISYILVMAISITFLLVFSIPSFKKIAYPNIPGLIGLVLNLTALTSAVITMINLIYTVLR